MIRHPLTLVPLLLLSSPAYSQQQPKTTTYYCGAEWAGGGSFNFATERWEGTVFNPDSLDYKFILKVRPVQNNLQVFRQVLDQDSYNITITPSGSSPPFDCLTGGVSQVVNSRFGRIKCDTPLYEYVFSLDFTRFLEVYIGVYINSKDNKDDTPSISGGTCTRKE